MHSTAWLSAALTRVLQRPEHVLLPALVLALAHKVYAQQAVCWLGWGSERQRQVCSLNLCIGNRRKGSLAIEMPGRQTAAAHERGTRAWPGL